MRLSLLLLLFLWLLAFPSQSQNRIQIHTGPTANEEADYVWRNLQDIAFFEEHGYEVVWPKGPLMDTLMQKGRSGTLTDADYTRLQSFMNSPDNYSLQDYGLAFIDVHEQYVILNQFIGQLKVMPRDWEFKLFNPYQVKFTLYGPGGSYDAETGTILLFTTPAGQFKQYDNPALTILHEIVHMGIEESIIQKYQVPHGLKERIVDLYVSWLISNEIGGYRIQNMGNPAIDAMLQTEEDWKELDAVVEVFMKSYPVD